MAGNERAIHLSSLTKRERRLLWIGVAFRAALVCIAAGSLLLMLFEGIHAIEARLAMPDGWSTASARRLGDLLTIVAGGLTFGAATWSGCQWLLRIPIGKLKFAIVRVEEAR